jgi:hypothetical protein
MLGPTRYSLAQGRMLLVVSEMALEERAATFEYHH